MVLNNAVRVVAIFGEHYTHLSNVVCNSPAQKQEIVVGAEEKERK